MINAHSIKRINLLMTVLICLTYLVLSRPSNAEEQNTNKASPPSGNTKENAQQYQDSAEKAWHEVIQLIQLKNGFITSAILQQTLGVDITVKKYTDDSYVAALKYNGDKNSSYQIDLHYRPRPIITRKEGSPLTTLDFYMPRKGCISETRFKDDMRKLGLKLVYLSTSNQGTAMYRGEGDVTISYSNWSSENTKFFPVIGNKCVNSIRISGQSQN